MMPTVPVPTSLDRLPQHLDSLTRSGRVELFIDRDLVGSSIHRSVLDTVADRPVQDHVVVAEADLDHVQRAARLLSRESVVVSVGGGKVIDQAKLAALAASDPRCARVLASSHRSGCVLLSDRVRRTVPLIVIPTTIGTGAESSRTACLRHGDRKKLVYGLALRSDVTVLDPAATRTLPPWLVMEGVLEAVIRVLSYYVGHRGEREANDRRTERLLIDLVVHGYIAAAHLARDESVPDPVRMRLAVLSGRTHHDDVIDGLDPFSDKCWPLANELSSAAGVRKLTAMALLLPELWRRILTGADSWGSPERLARLWSIVSREVPALNPSPLPGLTDLMDDWSIARRVPPPDVWTLARSTGVAWAHGLPMLHAVSQDELHSVYASSLLSPDDVSDRLVERR